jgi:hypothetical protein
MKLQLQDRDQPPQLWISNWANGRQPLNFRLPKQIALIDTIAQARAGFEDDAPIQVLVPPAPLQPGSVEKSALTGAKLSEFQHRRLLEDEVRRTGAERSDEAGDPLSRPVRCDW